MSEHIYAGVMIPGRGDPVEQAAVVLGDGGTIAYAGPRSDAPARADGDVVSEVPVVMPGLWDCHAHFPGIPFRPGVNFLTSNQLSAAARAVDDLGAVLDGGVTSVRDVGGMGLSLAAPVDEGRVRGPRIYGAGRLLSMSGGHGDYHAAPVEAASCAMYAHQFSVLCDGVPEVLRAVRLNLRDGASLIKVCASGGVMSQVDHPQHQQFSDEELAAAVQEAARAERIVAAHCHGKAGIMAALRAGCATIEHGSYLDEEAADLMLETGAMLVPTLFVIEHISAQLDNFSPEAAEKMTMVAQRHREAIELAVAKGIRMAAGCDIFTSGDGYGRNGLEITHLIAAGMSDLDAIAAATANGPATLGPQAPRSGQLVAGYDADVIALTANPLDDRSVWGSPDQVTHVWKAGARVK